MNIAVIVAMASNRVMGSRNSMPWQLPADLRRFKEITLNAPIIMGRKTFESIGKPLPQRTNIIVSRNPLYHAEPCLICADFDSALALACDTAPEVFVIGGAALYAQALPRAHSLYITQIHRDFEGDTFFPNWQQNDWQEVFREDVPYDATAGFAYSFLKFTRKKR